MVQEYCTGPCFLQGFRQHMSHAASRAKRLHMLRRHHNIFRIPRNQADICKGTGEEYRQAIFLCGLIGCLCQSKGFLPVEIGFRIYRQKRCEIVFHG